GGLCLVLVPNLQSLAVRLLGMRYRYVYPQHLNYFSRASLKGLVSSRFEVTEARSMHFNPMAIWQDWRAGGVEVTNAQRAALLERTTAYKQNPWLKPVKGIYWLTEQILGRLNLADNLVQVLRKRC